MHPLLLGAGQDYDIKVRCPSLELPHTILECALGTMMRCGPGHVTIVLEVSEKGDSLEGFAETHLVFQNPIEAIVV